MCPRPPCPSTPPTTPTRQPVPAGAEARTCSALQTPADPAPSVPTHVLVSLGEHVGPETLRAPDASRISRRLSPGPLGAAPSRKELILLPERPSRQHFQSLLFSSKCGVAPILPLHGLAVLPDAAVCRIPMPSLGAPSSLAPLTSAATSPRSFPSPSAGCVHAPSPLQRSLCASGARTGLDFPHLYNGGANSAYLI